MRERRLKPIVHGICVLSFVDPGAGFCHIPTTEAERVGQVPQLVREFLTQMRGSQHWVALGTTLVKAVLSGIHCLSFGGSADRSHRLVFDNPELF